MSDINSILPDYYKHKIAIVGKRIFFIQLRDALVDCIIRYGFEAKAYTEVEEALADNPTCVVVINPMLYPVPQDRGIIWIMIQTEQLFNDGTGSNQVFLRGNRNNLKTFLKAYDIILDADNSNVKGLKKITEAVVKYFPNNWFPALDICDDLKGDPRKNEYDLLFIGNMPGVDGRRKRLLDFLATKYKVYPIRNDLWAENKAIAMYSSKICLNIHYDESRYVESSRLNDYFANHCFVLSEPMYNTEPYIEGEDFAEFYWTNICEKIDYYLEHEEEREEIAESAYNKIHKKTLMDSAKVLIDSLLLESYDRYQAEKDRAVNTLDVRIKTAVKKFLRMDKDD